jgi:hypothetical protein
MIKAFDLQDRVLTVHVLLRFHGHQEDIVEGRVDPPLEGLRALGEGLLDLLPEEAVEGIGEREDEFSLHGEVEVLPVEDAGVVVEALQDFDLGKGPGVYFLEGLIDSHNHVGDALLEEVEVLPLGLERLLEPVRAAVPKVP